METVETASTTCVTLNNLPRAVIWLIAVICLEKNIQKKRVSSKVTPNYEMTISSGFVILKDNWNVNTNHRQ